jgi:hypothetical protein
MQEIELRSLSSNLIGFQVLSLSGMNKIEKGVFYESNLS